MLPKQMTTNITLFVCLHHVVSNPEITHCSMIIGIRETCRKNTDQDYYYFYYHGESSKVQNLETISDKCINI